MSSVHVDVGEGDDGTDEGARKRRRRGSNAADIEIEREVTKQKLIESITSIVVVILYMVFTLMREREAGIVVLDGADDDLGPEDDWAEG